MGEIGEEPSHLVRCRVPSTASRRSLCRGINMIDIYLILMRPSGAACRLGSLAAAASGVLGVPPELGPPPEPGSRVRARPALGYMREL